MTLGAQERNKEFELKKEIKALKAQYEEVPEVIEQSGGIS